MSKSLTEILKGSKNIDTFQDTLKLNQSLTQKATIPAVIIQNKKFVLKETKAVLGDHLECIILCGVPVTGNAKAFFPDGFSGNSSKPDCYSFDGKTPAVSDPVSESCQNCPNNVWGSGANRKGKACRDSKTLLLYLLNPGRHGEIVSLRVTGMAIGNLSNYVREFVANDVAVYKFASRITLAPESKYPTPDFSIVAEVDPESHKDLEDILQSQDVIDFLNR